MAGADRLQIRSEVVGGFQVDAVLNRVERNWKIQVVSVMPRRAYWFAESAWRVTEANLAAQSAAFELTLLQAANYARQKGAGR